jgi:hypothetical protein
MEDPSGYLQVASLEQQRARAADLPLEVLTEEAVSRGLIPNAVGLTAASGEVELAIMSDEAFEDRVGNFLDSEAKPCLADQLMVSAYLWAKLGYEAPVLSDTQFDNLSLALEANPGLRVVPTPLMSIDQRKAATASVDALLTKKLKSDLELWTPDGTWEFAELIKDPHEIINKDGVNYGMRYKTDSGHVVGRSTYVDELKASGQAIEAEDGAVWIFPLMDISPKTPRNDTRAGNLHALVDPITAPEALLTVQLMRLINGSANASNWELDIANEAVYELDEEGQPTIMMYAASVAWLYGFGKAERVHANFWEASISSGGFGLRNAKSGLGPET